MSMIRRAKVNLLLFLCLGLLLGLSPSLALGAKDNRPLMATWSAEGIRFITPLKGASALRVEVFDLQGVRLFDSGPIFNHSVDWRLTDQSGTPVARGVYLYVATIWNDQGQEIGRKLGKVAVTPDAVGMGSSSTFAARPPENPLTPAQLPLVPLLDQDHSTEDWAFGRIVVGEGTDPVNAKELIAARKNTTGPTIIVHNKGGAGGAQFQMVDDASGANFKFKSTGTGGFKIRDHANGIDVLFIPSNTGDVGIGTSTPQATLDVVGDNADLIRAADAANPSNAVFRVQKDGNVYADGSFNCGLSSQGACFVTGSGADVAERIDASEPLEPGDVVEIDPDNPGTFRKSRGPLSTRVAGVISTAPGVTLGNDFDPVNDRWEDNRPLIALAGRVPVKVTTENGPIQVGDLLVSSSQPGVAMRCVSDCLGAVIGKALEPLAEGQGTVLALVTLR